MHSFTFPHHRALGAYALTAAIARSLLCVTAMVLAVCMAGAGASPALAVAPPSPPKAITHGGSPPVVKGRAQGKRVSARAAAVPLLTTDARLDCYPEGGGIMGGGTYNNSVRVSLDWRTMNGGTYWAGHRVLLEWVSGGVTRWMAPGEVPTTSYAALYVPFYGPYHVTPRGVSEWMNDIGMGGTATTPWSWEQPFAKSQSHLVRAWVQYYTHNGSAWEWTPWVLAPSKGSSMQNPGWCSFG